MDHQPDLPSSADFARIEEELFDRIAVRYRRQVVRHRLVAVAAVLVVAGAGVAAGTVANPILQTKVAYCYGGDSTNYRVTELELPDHTKSTKPGTNATSAQVANAVALCRSIWRQGVFSGSPSAGAHPVPELQPCLRDDLVVSIFRKTDVSESADTFCGNLGLSAP